MYTEDRAQFVDNIVKNMKKLTIKSNNFNIICNMLICM